MLRTPSSGSVLVMSENRILTFYPPLDGRFDLVAGLRRWLDHDGKFEFAFARVLEPFDPETHLEPVTRGYRVFDPGDLDTLRPVVDEHDVMLSLNARWYGPGIQAMSYHHADPPIMFWSFDPVLWGRGEGGADRADAGLLAFARAAGAAYVLATTGLGYEVTRHRFVQDPPGYRFVLPPYDPRRGHGMLWVDVCRELGGVEPRGYIQAGRVARPFGYTRFLLAGTEPETFDDD
jgi:hypothetical protein